MCIGHVSAELLHYLSTQAAMANGDVPVAWDDKELGITFSRITVAQRKKVLDFLAVNFFPHEPICRSLNFQPNLSVKPVFDDHIKSGVSVMAVDKNGRLLGVRMATVLHKNSTVKKKFETSNTICRKLITGELEYNVWKYHEEFSVEKILSDGCLCSLKDSGIRGVGTELLRQSEAIGREEGCEMTSALVTGLYSGKIFRNAGYRILKEVQYANFRDEDGELYLKDTREHLSCCVMTKRF